jgi:hypothetical protein
VANPSRRKGTVAENGVVDYFRKRGWPHAERRALAGTKDRGDLAGVHGIAGAVVVEVKNCARLEPGWLDEVAREQANAEAVLGVVVAKRRGRGNPGEWVAMLTLRQLCDLLAAAGYRGGPDDLDSLIARLKARPEGDAA